MHIDLLCTQRDFFLQSQYFLLTLELFLLQQHKSLSNLDFHLLFAVFNIYQCLKLKLFVQILTKM